MTCFRKKMDYVTKWGKPVNYALREKEYYLH
jgi:hypothetical protein